MKRYNLTCGYCKTSGASTWKENLNGKWVSWEDHMAELQQQVGDVIRDLEAEKDYANLLVKTQNGQELEAAVCNCCKMLLDPDRAIMDDAMAWWICPAHGYKKR